MKDEEAQKSGVVFVYNGIDQTKFEFRTAKYFGMIRAQPCRWVAFHVCQANTPTLNALRPLMIKLLEKMELCRYRHHMGK